MRKFFMWVTMSIVFGVAVAFLLPIAQGDPPGNPVCPPGMLEIDDIDAACLDACIPGFADEFEAADRNGDDLICIPNFVDNNKRRRAVKK